MQGDDIPSEHHALIPSFMGGGGGKKMLPLPFLDSTPDFCLTFKLLDSAINCHMYVVQTRSMDPSKDLSAYGYGSAAWKERLETWRQKQERLIKNEDGDKDWGNDGDEPYVPVHINRLAIGYEKGKIPYFVEDLELVIDLISIDMIANAMVVAAIFNANQPSQYICHAEDVFESLAIPLMKLVGLKTEEMVNEGRSSAILMDSTKHQVSKLRIPARDKH
ncbi:hypothetical protein GIB67_025209 [Kingdonia uniflora]|uniref:Fatty acyl-CoA reductase n=1 Tax=Kingdonia uniflora TaxID=39325 RepID=A0A7J7N870_9MAGN|nr:hypothetical protein GIB67_025209 [Kingdonia uniflora]